MDITEQLSAFCSKHKFHNKGALCVALVVSRHAREKGLPLCSDQLLTEKGGQVLGLGKSAVQKILKTHGIERVLAAEGGRTSRGSIKNMNIYVEFLNKLHSNAGFDLNTVETFWIERVRVFFAGKPFSIKLDGSKNLRTLLKDVMAQAEERQKSNPGMQYAGAVLQHIVGAKLDLALGEKDLFEHHSFSTSDEQTGRAGDFLIGDVAIHVTTSPGESLIVRCRDNLDDGYQPLIVTTQRGLTAAEVLAENTGLGERIDVFEAEQFIALNLYELGRFSANGRRVAVQDLVARYNKVIDLYETDPSLKIVTKR